MGRDPAYHAAPVIFRSCTSGVSDRRAGALLALPAAPPRQFQRRPLQPFVTIIAGVLGGLSLGEDAMDPKTGASRRAGDKIRSGAADK